MINNFLREGTYTDNHVSYFNDIDASAIFPLPLDTSGVYTNRNGVEYRLKIWPPGLRAASNRYDTLFVETLGDNSLNFNILSEALFASKSYNPITSVGLFNDELSNKLLLVLEASCDTSYNLLNNFSPDDANASASIVFFFSDLLSSNVLIAGTNVITKINA